MQDRGPFRLVADGSLADHTSDMERESGVGAGRVGSTVASTSGVWGIV